MDTTTIANKLKYFRSKIYAFFPKRQDASMELVDALSSNITATSIVGLSQNEAYRRNYCSITRSLDEYYPSSIKNKEEHDNKLSQLAIELLPEPSQRNFLLFAIDCTPAPRIFSPTLDDRGFVYSPNTVAGNKPVTIGHQYSVLVALPEKKQFDSPWVLPISCKRVTTSEKAVGAGIRQLNRCIYESEVLKQKLCVVTGDSAYSKPDCLHESNKHANQVHIARLSSNRTLYRQFFPEKKVKRGRPKVYGKKIRLNDKRTLGKVDESVMLDSFNKKGKKIIVKIKAWKNIVMRGKHNLPMHECPFTLVKVDLFRADGTLIYKRAMWLVVSGEKRDKLDLKEIYHSYRQRFDIEHFFRFGKCKLLIDRCQSSDVSHEEAWWQIGMMAYTQLYLSKGLVNSIPNPWEKYLPNFKCKTNVASPTQAQKDFFRIFQEIGTPAQAPKPRNKASGRQSGDTQLKRPRCKVVIKGKKRKNTQLKSVA